MPRNPKGEMNVSEIRNLVRQHNKLSVIDNVDKKSRATLIAEIRAKGFELDHKKKSIVSRTGGKVIEQSKKAEPKPQKATKKKMLIAGGDKPVMATKKTLKTKAKADKKAKIAEYDQMVRKYPTIPANVKGRKIGGKRKKATIPKKKKKTVPTSW
jgi:ribosome biogenesis SPOUT family RNA methylase Rps3